MKGLRQNPAAYMRSCIRESSERSPPLQVVGPRSTIDALLFQVQGVGVKILSALERAEF